MVAVKFYSVDDHDNSIYSKLEQFPPYKKGDFVAFDGAVPTHEIQSISHILKLDTVIVLVKPIRS